MVLALPAPLTRPKRVTHPEDRLRTAAEFRFPSDWKRTENKPGRQGSRRASGFLEDTAASPAEAAAPSKPRRDSHFFCLGYAKNGAALRVGWGPGDSGRRGRRRSEGPSGARRRPVTQQYVRARDPGRLALASSAHALARGRVTHRGGEMLLRGAGRVEEQHTAGKGAAVVRRLASRDTHANRKSGPRELGGNR